MAQTEYSGGVAEVAPAPEAPAPFQSGRGATAEAFGGGTAQGLEKLGQGMLTSSKFFGKVAADNASNDFQDFATKLLHGDPSKSTMGPDGQPVPDTGYLGLKGRAALDARPDVQKSIDQKIKEIRESLSTPEQQLEFDNFSRRYRTGVVERVGGHATQQASSWYTDVNTATAKLALDHISNNFDSPKDVAAGASDLANAYVKNVEIKGGGAAQIQEAIAHAKRDALTAQLSAMAVKDPSRAMAILEKNRTIAGLSYDNLATAFRARADTQRGDEAANEALKKTYVAPPPQGAFRNAVLAQAGAPHGISENYLVRTQQLENPRMVTTANQAGAVGPFQFIPSTAKQYGLKNPLDLAESADAAARLAADNKRSLTQSLGRPPTDAELYLAHQQGSGGAAALLRYPTMTAAEALQTVPKYAGKPGAAAEAIRQNGGDPNAPAAAFTSMWATKFNGSPGAATSLARKAQAYQDIMSDPNLSDAARQHAITRVNQQITAQQVAEEQDLKARKIASDKAMDGYVTRMLTGQNTTNIVNEIANNPDLDPSVKWSLGQAAEKQSGDDVHLASQSYGPGFWNAYKQATAPMGDPSRVSDISVFLQQAGPGVDPAHQLTLAGVMKLRETMAAAAKSVDGASVTTTKTGLMNYAKSKLSFEQDTGPVKIRDPEGEAIFNSVFIPKFEAAYSNWVSSGKSPWEFLTQKNVDEYIKGLRDKTKMDQQRLLATGGELPAEPNPAAPEFVDQKAWDRFMGTPPLTPKGTPWPKSQWAKAIELLRADPSPARQAQFDKHFAPSGYTAKEILSRLPPVIKKSSNEPASPGIRVPPNEIMGMGIRG